MSKELIERMNHDLKEDGMAVFLLATEIFGFIDSGVFLSLESSSILARSPIVCFIPSLIYAYIEYKSAKKSLILEKFLDDNKENYIVLSNLYNKYLDLVANILSKYKFDSVLELCISIDFLLSEGIFSKTDKLKFHNYNIVESYYMELLGTVVFTGGCVCRHYASIAGDLLTRLNIKNFEVYVRKIGKKNKLIRNNKANHVVVGLVDDNKKFTYDFTAHATMNIIDEKTLCLPHEKFNLFYNITSVTDIDSFKNTDSQNLTYLEIKEIADKVRGRFLPIFKELQKLKEDNIDTINEISDKAVTLMLRK